MEPFKDNLYNGYKICVTSIKIAINFNKRNLIFETLAFHIFPPFIPFWSIFHRFCSVCCQPQYFLFCYPTTCRSLLGVFGTNVCIYNVVVYNISQREQPLYYTCFKEFNKGPKILEKSVGNLYNYLTVK